MEMPHVSGPAQIIYATWQCYIALVMSAQPSSLTSTLEGRSQLDLHLEFQVLLSQVAPFETALLGSVLKAGGE